MGARGWTWGRAHQEGEVIVGHDAGDGAERLATAIVFWRCSNIALRVRVSAGGVSAGEEGGGGGIILR